jgi:hypothetical protein
MKYYILFLNDKLQQMWRYAGTDLEKAKQIQKQYSMQTLGDVILVAKQED